MMNQKTMKAARLYEPGGDFRIDELPIPEVRPTDVLVRVGATGMVPNLRNVITSFAKQAPRVVLPRLPAVFGLDAAGVVAAVGTQVRTGVEVGSRVYVNPALTCGSCEACRRADPTSCRSFTFMGYFGYGPGAQAQYDAYPYAGFAEYLTCPVANIVKLPDSVSVEQGARFGYLGTAYAALRKARFAPGHSVVVNGGTGTLGVGAVAIALAMGASKVFGVGRDPLRLERLRSLDPRRVHAISSAEGSVADQVMAVTGGRGVDAVIEALAPGSPAQSVLDAIGSLRHGGTWVNIGGVTEKISVAPNIMTNHQLSLVGSRWFSTGEGQDMADMAAAGTLNLGMFEHEVFPLERINEALRALDARHGGFSNFVIRP